ncbi:MAG: hypothetical protein PHC46_01940 [Clostridia bacterium]|nr:hypothetical protein [Clostridia bacterium]
MVNSLIIFRSKKPEKPSDFIATKIKPNEEEYDDEIAELERLLE